MSGLSARERTRSPRFPSQSLNDSLRHVQMIYEGVHRSPIDAETAFRLMGFSGKTGTSAKALASLRQYGLIEGIGENTRVTDLAMAILEPESSLERSRSIYRASRSPDVFDAVLSRFDQRLPSVDEPIRAFLIRELGFQKNSADDLIQTLRESLALADSLQAPTDQGAVAQSDSPDDAADEHASDSDRLQLGAQTVAVESSELPTQRASIPLGRSSRAELQLYGPLTERTVANLIRAIELLADVWAEEEEA